MEAMTACLSIARRRSWLEEPDLKNGAPEPTKRTEKKSNFSFPLISVLSVAPFLRSGASVPPPRRPVSMCSPRPAAGVWTLWEYRWTPPAAGDYSIALRIPDASMPQRQLDAGYYIQRVSVDAR
jgi:hypothetical protein